MARGNVTSKILTFLATLPPQAMISLSDLTDLGLRKEQAQTAMYRLIQNDRWPLDTISAGHLWRNRGHAEPQSDPEPGWSVALIEDMGAVKVINIEGYVYVARRIGLAGE